MPKGAPSAKAKEPQVRRMRAHSPAARSILTSAGPERPEGHGAAVGRQAPPQFAYHLSTYVFGHKLSAMVSYLWMGFELELYHPREYRMVLWYLDYLLGVLISNTKIASQFVLADESYRAKGARAVSFSRAPYCAGPTSDAAGPIRPARWAAVRQRSKRRRMHGKQNGWPKPSRCPSTSRFNCCSRTPCTRWRAACCGCVGRSGKNVPWRPFRRLG